MGLFKRIKVRWWLWIAAQKGKHRKYAQAAQILSNVVQAQPNSALALVQLGFSLSKLNRTDEARDAYERALQIAPNNAEAHAYLGLLYSELRNNQEALASLNRAVRMKPSLMKNQFWLYRLGLMQGNAQQWEQALKSFQELTRLNRKYGSAWHGVGWAYTNLNQIAQATAALERAVQLIPTDPVVQAELGRAYLAQERTKEALEHLNRSVELRQSEGETHLDLCNDYCDLCGAYCPSGDLEQALAFALRASKCAPGSPQPYPYLSYVYNKLGRTGDAAKAIQTAIQITPDDADLYVELARINLEAKNLPDALAASREAVRLSPHSANAYLCLGCALHDEPTYGEAAAAYQKALELNPNQFESRVNLGEIYLRRGQCDEALKAFLAAAKIKSHGELHFYLGEVYVRLGRRGDAERERQALIELHDPRAGELAKLIDSSSVPSS